MTKEIEQKIIEFTNQINLKLNKNEQQVLNGIIKNSWIVKLKRTLI